MNFKDKKVAELQECKDLLAFADKVILNNQGRESYLLRLAMKKAKQCVMPRIAELERTLRMVQVFSPSLKNYKQGSV